MSKARKVTIDGIVFDSRMEGRRYAALKILQMAGLITDLKCHTKHVLQEGFTLDGKRIRAITWTDDFSYFDHVTETFVVEDVKGFQREDNKLRHKLYMFRYQQPITLIKHC